MPTRSRLALLLASALVLGVAAPAAASGAIDTARRTADAAAFEGRLIVVWKGEAPRTLHMAGVASTSPMERPMRSVVTTKPGRSAAVARSLRADPRVLAVVPDAQLSFLDWPADGNPSDTRYGEQGDLAQIGVPEAWTTTRGDPSVVVAVIDSGIDLTHPDLDGVAVVDPRNMVWNNDDVSDQVGHGTHVMGTIVAETNNGEGIAGIAPDSTLMPIKIADDSGFVAFSDMLDGVDWAREHGADVINMSLGGALTVDQVALGQPTFTAARDAGILMVAAAGNDATQIRMYPASFAGVVSVSAVDSTDTIAEFSNIGRAVDIAAPGVDLLSTIPGGDYALGSGTSMSSPHVAGVAALIRAARPGLDVDEVEAVLRASAVDLGAPGHDMVYGDGRVDAAAALVEPVPDPIPDLDPPAPFPPLTLSFIAPAAKVTQTATDYTVLLDIGHEVVDSIALLGSWAQTNGHCKDDGKVRVQGAHLRPDDPAPQPEAGPLLPGVRRGRGRGPQLQRGHLAADQDPRRDAAGDRGAGPRAGKHHVSRSANVRIRFSEPVVLKGTPAVIRNAHTGKAVAAKATWDAKTSTLVLDPTKALQRPDPLPGGGRAEGRRSRRQPPRAGPLELRHRLLIGAGIERPRCVNRGRCMWSEPRARGRGSAARQAATRARPWASCAASAQSIRQPRASRPPIGAKWNQTSSPLAARCSRQPQVLQVIGPLRPSMASAMWLVSKAGYVIGAPGRTAPRDAAPSGHGLANGARGSTPLRRRPGCGSVARRGPARRAHAPAGGRLGGRRRPRRRAPRGPARRATRRPGPRRRSRAGEPRAPIRRRGGRPAGAAARRRAAAPSSRVAAASASRTARTDGAWSAATWRPDGSHRYARPPVIPAPKFGPTGPSTTTAPPVMYSQPCGPTPSTTASAPELRTANRIPARPTTCSRPAVAP